MRPFHLAFPVRNLEEAKAWYCDTLGCKVGRESDDWIDFDFFGHQVVAHLSSTIINDNSNDGTKEAIQKISNKFKKLASLLI